MTFSTGTRSVVVGTRNRTGAAGRVTCSKLTVLEPDDVVSARESTSEVFSWRRAAAADPRSDRTQDYDGISRFCRFFAEVLHAGGLLVLRPVRVRPLVDECLLLYAVRVRLVCARICHFFFFNTTL